MKGFIFYNDEGKKLMSLSEPFYHPSFGETVIVAMVEGESVLSVEGVTTLRLVKESGLQPEEMSKLFRRYAEGF